METAKEEEIKEGVLPLSFEKQSIEEESVEVSMLGPIGRQEQAAAALIQRVFRMHREKKRAKLMRKK